MAQAVVAQAVVAQALLAQLVLAQIVLALLVLAAPAGAADRFRLFRDFDRNADLWEMRFGVLSFDSGALTRRQNPGITANLELLGPTPGGILDFIGTPRPFIGLHLTAVAANQPIHFLYGGLAWEAYFTERLYLTASFGGGVHTAPILDGAVGYPSLGCRLIFHEQVALGFDITPRLTAQLYADHFSNGGFCSPNHGQETAGGRIGVRF